MISTITSYLSDGFIQLHRTFHELSQDSVGDDEIDISRALLPGTSLSWEDLLKEHRLVVLSEAGSGKTYEICNIARTLRAQKAHAFFLRLEDIPEDFEDAFEVGTYQDFEEWLASSEEGWLFLDSVDEARLRHPRNFEQAIRIVRKKIKTALERAHFVITGRTSAWRPKTDYDCCTNHLSYSIKDTAIRTSPDGDGDPQGSLQTETITQEKDKPAFKIVTLDNLTSEQIRVFVKARGIENSKAFLNAVERADAWLFTARPQDLKELIDFWLNKGRIGTRLEIMQNSIERRLDEREQSRADTYPLSVERARGGARLLAAATTLMRNPTIRVPDGTENSKGLPVKAVLPDWNDKDQATLLSRPIFDEAIYGAVRFHHRSVREYLTAEWIAELLKCETSRRSIEGLFFRNQYELEIVTPTLRPILPWLLLLDDKIRKRVCQIAPEIIFEGGDPSQLPLEERRHILHKVCKQIAEDTTDRSNRDYSAVQHFANSDLTEDIRSLIREYADKGGLVIFLLRMVRIGELLDALPEVKNIALTPTTKKYTRLAAFSALKVIGSKEDQQQVRQSLLTETSELTQEWLAELLEDVEPTVESLDWLLACLEKLESEKSYATNYLRKEVITFIDTADLDLLPALTVGFNRLLSLPPVIERQFCEISKRFKWLMVPVSKAIKRLITATHPASLNLETLALLHKLSSVTGDRVNDLNEVEIEFSTLVPAWKELNYALFWFEVDKSREAFCNKAEKRVNKFSQISPFGKFWDFKADDFQYFAEQINDQSLQDNKLLALSLAFMLYVEAKRPSAWRIQLKKLVADNNELSAQLKNYLRPPAQAKEVRRFKQEKKRREQRREAEHRKKEKYHADRKMYLEDNLEIMRSTLSQEPGAITNDLFYLFNRTQEEKQGTERWTDYNWKTLIPEYGERIAHFYRDSVVSLWRHYKPKLRSEGTSLNKIPYAVIFGLTGLEIEFHETSSWFQQLTAEEVELACKYASFELDDFPIWFPKLFEQYPTIVGGFLIQEMQYELSIEELAVETHYIVHALSCSGQWAWNQIAPSIYDFLETSEPKNLSTLDKLLKILQGSSLLDDSIEKLASQKCSLLESLDHAACWFAVWTGVSPQAAIISLKNRIEAIADSEGRTWFAMTFITGLLGERSSFTNAVREVFKTPEYLKSLYLLMHGHIRAEDDIQRVGMGVYSPELRDEAQDARESLLSLLKHIPGKESFLALKEIAQVHPKEAARSRIDRYAEQKAEQDGDLEAWSPSQVKEFHNKLERTPRTHKELAELAVFRLLDLKDDLEHGDSSIARILQKVEKETEMRNFIGHELREKAFGRYSIPQEEELADAKRPDLRFHGMGFDGPVPVELKLANNWSGPRLFERLENQLCGNYLRDSRSNRGIFVLVHVDKKAAWDMPSSTTRVNFVELIAALQEYWQQISPKFPFVDDVTVIGIDLTKRSG